MKTQRNLSGIYFRSKVGEKWDNVCFEDLTQEEQDTVMAGRPVEWVKSLAKKLADTLNEIGEVLDLVKQ